MLILNEHNSTIILEDVAAPVISDYFWVLDMTIMDYTLTPLLFLEEMVCPTMTILVNGFQFDLPASWNVLVYDPETLQLDVVSVSDLAGKELNALIYGAKSVGPLAGVVRILDYKVESKSISPSLTKNQMLCHPISPTKWINISPSDAYNKYLKDCIVSDIIQF